jgi:predicted DNA-binding antitoxin AbrB/MazE fold protein
MQQLQRLKLQEGIKINLKTQQTKTMYIRIKTVQKMFKEKIFCHLIRVTKLEERFKVKTV